MQEYIRYPTEMIDDLLCKDLKIIQDEKSYRFAIDAVLLANFVKAGKKDRVIDLGTGSGVIPLLVSAKTEAKQIVGLEILEDVAERAKRSVEMNDLQQRIKIVCGDLKDAAEIFGRESFSVVVTNPPYMTINEGKISPDTKIAIARHEVAATLEDIIKSASSLLTFGGRFYMVYRTFRMAEAFWVLKKHGIEPKILRIIQPREKEEANLFMLMAKKGGKTGLTVMPPLVVYNDNDTGEYTKEIMSIYFDGLDKKR